MKEPIIAHLDMDAFFAAIEERDNPRFQGRPLVVGADPREGRGRGVVSTCNYPARAYGIRSAMPIGKAWQLSEAARRRGEPPAIFFPGSWRRYSAVSEEIMALLAARAERVLVVGVDEAYLDLTGFGSYTAAAAAAAELKAQIFSATRLTASVGLAPNKLVAKIASDFNKPNGLVVVEPPAVVGFLAPLSVRTLPGVGPKGEQELARLGIRTIADLQQRSADWLREHFGKHGEYLFRKAHGQGSASLDPHGLAKSISEQVTFYNDTLSPREIITQCIETAERVGRRVADEGFTGWRNVTIMARFASFVTRTRAHTLPEVQTSQTQLTHEALRMLLPFFDRRENPRHEPLRLIGVRVAKLQK